MSVMFANNRTDQANSGYLVEFKAGRSNLQAGSTAETRKVVADKLKGSVFIKQSGDQLVHFCWKNRESGAVVDDLIIFPGDTEFVRVKECTDGRVYMLKFKSTDERRLFWMQDGKTDKDEENCKKVNETLNNPPVVRASTRGGTERTGAAASFGGLAALSGAGADSELSALGNLDQSQLMQLLSLMNQSGANTSSSTAAAAANLQQLSANATAQASSTEGTGGTSSAQLATPSNTPANGTVAGSTTGANPIQLAQLKDIIAQINPDATARASIDLADVLCGDNAIESVRNNGDRLIPHLPNQEPVYTAQEELEQTVRAPQFRQAVNIFGHALQSGQLAPVLQQFGMPNDVTRAAQTGDAMTFSQKLTAAEEGASSSSTNNPIDASSSAMPLLKNAEIDAQIAKEAEAEETNESAIRKGKGQKEDDGMDLD